MTNKDWFVLCRLTANKLRGRRHRMGVFGLPNRIYNYVKENFPMEQDEWEKYREEWKVAAAPDKAQVRFQKKQEKEFLEAVKMLKTENGYVTLDEKEARRIFDLLGGETRLAETIARMTKD